MTDDRHVNSFNVGLFVNYVIWRNLSTKFRVLKRDGKLMSGSQNNRNIEIITVISNTSSTADCS